MFGQIGVDLVLSGPEGLPVDDGLAERLTPLLCKIIFKGGWKLPMVECIPSDDVSFDRSGFPGGFEQKEGQESFGGRGQRRIRHDDKIDIAAQWVEAIQRQGAMKVNPDQPVSQRLFQPIREIGDLFLDFWWAVFPAKLSHNRAYPNQKG